MIDSVGETLGVVLTIIGIGGGVYAAASKIVSLGAALGSEREARESIDEALTKTAADLALARDTLARAVSDLKSLEERHNVVAKEAREGRTEQDAEIEKLRTRVEALQNEGNRSQVRLDYLDRELNRKASVESVQALREGIGEIKGLIQAMTTGKKIES